MSASFTLNSISPDLFQYFIKKCILIAVVDNFQASKIYAVMNKCIILIKCSDNALMLKITIGNAHLHYKTSYKIIMSMQLVNPFF